MTLNQVINRIKLISLSHKQVRNFYKGLVSDFLVDHTTLYPSVFLQDNGGSISLTNNATTLSYRMFIMDLVHVSQGQKENEQDVHSDTLSIAQDLIAQMNFGAYKDWRLSFDSNLQFVVEENSDMYAGVIVDFSISLIYTQNVCQVPTDLEIIDPTEEDMDKLVFDIEYIATGNEGVTLTTSGSSPNIPTINGMKILLITREQAPMHKVSNNPDPAEYTWDNVDIVFGTSINQGERFLILYRKY